MKITKKLLAVVLSALILVASLPVMAVSAEEFTADNGLKYTVTDGKATVIGYEGEATEVVIPDTLGGATVTTIGAEAFQYNSVITSVTLPESLEVIKEEAFENCQGLTGIDIPDGVVTIEREAFANCIALATVDLSNSLTYLGASAFDSTAIESIEIPKSFDKADRAYYTYSYTLDGVEYAVSVGPFALCDNLKTVTFEKGTTQIAENLFRGCTGLEEITLPETLTVIEGSAFESCLRLKSIDIPDTVTSINGEAFKNCVSLKDVELSKGLTYLGASAFASTPIESVEIPRALDKTDHSYYTYRYTLDGVEYSFYDGPFVFCDNLKTVTFEKGVNQIAEGLFRGCTGLEEITIPDTVTVIEGSAFEGCLRLKGIEIPDYVTAVNDRAFNNCVSLKTVDLGKNLASLGASAFANTPIESVEIPKSLDKAYQSYGKYKYTLDGVEYSFYDGPFLFCNSLKTVTFEEGTTQVAENLFSGCTGLEKIVIPEGVTVIEESAFHGAVLLNDITIPESVTTIGNSAFESCASLGSIVLSESVAKIDSHAFRNCDSMTSFEAKNADAVLGGYVLADNEKLTDVKLPANLIVLNDGLFYNDKALKTIEIPASVVEIGNTAFAYCATLDEIVVPENVEKIESQAFKNCVSLKSATLPEALDTLGDNAFYGCESLTDVKFEDYSIKKINASTFAECYSLKEIKLPKGLEEIESNAFVNCIELFDVTIPESVTVINGNILSYPGKTTIYSQSGSYVETYANDGGFKFVDNVTDVETIKLKDGATKLILEEDKTYKLELDITPVDADECIKLTTSNSYVVSVDGMELTTNWRNETVEIKAETLSGAVLTFEVYVRGIDYIRFAEDSQYQTKYATGDEFNPDGIKLEAVYSDETVVEIDGYTFEGFDSSEPGECKIYVKWIDNNGEEHSYYFYVEILGEEPPTFQSQKDETTQIVVEAVTNATLSVVEITDKFKFDEVNLKLSGEQVSKFYDITLVEDGVAVQPDGTVTVKIPCDDETAKVYRFEDDGTLTDMNAEFVDGFMVFTTEHFSLYVVTVEAEASEFEIGDVNKDGKLNIRDATVIQKYIAKMTDLDEEALSLADFDGNGKVNVKDATAIQKKIAGII